MKDDDGKRLDTGQERLEKNQAHLERMRREDDGEFQRSTRDPEFTVEELANMSGFTRRHVRRLLRDAGVGFPAIRQRPNGGVPIKTTIVRWSQLKRLVKEFGW